MVFYAHYKFQIPEEALRRKARRNRLIGIMNFVVQSVSQKGKSTEDIKAMLLGNAVLEKVVDDFESNLAFEDGEKCFRCFGIEVWCDNSLGENEAVLICK